MKIPDNLDELVAIHVFGEDSKKFDALKEYRKQCDVDMANPKHSNMSRAYLAAKQIPDACFTPYALPYSTHIGYAWDIVEKLRTHPKYKSFTLQINFYTQLYIASFPQHLFDTEYDAHATNPAQAICLAALKLLGVKYET